MNELAIHYSKIWNLSDLHEIAETRTGHIYKLNSRYGEAVLKIFTETGLKDEIGGSFFLEACAGHGAVKLYEYDEKAQLIEFLPGENLNTFSRDGSEDQATLVFINLIKKIHSCNIINKEKLVTLHDLFRLFDRLIPPADLSDLFKKAKDLAIHLMDTQTKEVLLHGDLHHENVLKNSKGEFVCFDPKGMVGDPSYELATTLKNPWDYPQISQDMEIFKSRAKTFSKKLDLPYQRILDFTFVHLCLSVGWAIEDGDSYSHQMILIKKLNQLIR